MIVALICVISLAALGQIFVSYCRSALASARKADLSERFLAVAGIESKNIPANDFDRILELVRLCPDYEDGRGEIRAVGVYRNLLEVLGRVSRTAMPKLAAWSEQERQSCSYFAAVVLDRCISSSRELFVQHASDRL
ncbi:MAG TPA: hypothetical protein VN822_13415 [Candidatus Acidoferrales bacterium]|nr:hypothetical protein [Candidatus Acidoferrales bacterium]